MATNSLHPAASAVQHQPLRATRNGDGLRILLVATKAPWPPIDGGRVLLAEQLRGLRRNGIEATLVAPCAADSCGEVQEALQSVCDVRLVPQSPQRESYSPLRRAVSALRPSLLSTPYSFVQHRSLRGQEVVRTLLRGRRFDVVHVEQLQGLGLVPPDLLRPVPAPQDEPHPPVVVRCQNVESDLWLGLSSTPAPLSATSPQRFFWSLARPLFAGEARRMRRAEVAALNQVSKVLTITARDRDRLLALGVERHRLAVLAPPMHVDLPSRRSPLPGSPALTLLGSGGWLPNRLANSEFLQRVWPQIRADLPDARLHVFGAPDARAKRASEDPALTFHSGDTATEELFDPSSTLLVPLQVGSGIRMKILDAFARRVPVVASPCAAAGLDAEALEALSLAQEAATWSAAVQELRDATVRTARVERGVDYLRTHHRPERIAEQLTAHYTDLSRPPAKGSNCSGTSLSAEPPDAGQATPC